MSKVESEVPATYAVSGKQGATRKRGTTRERVLDVGLQLFSSKGFDGTAVRDLEEAAGLTPGRGSFYRHFASKEAVLEAVVEREIGRIEQLRDLQQRAVRGTLGDLRAETILECRLILMALDDIKNLINILAREYGRFPDIMQRVSKALIDESRELYAKDFSESIRSGAIKGGDPRALTAVFQSALVGYHLTKTYFGQTPAGVESELFIRTLADLMFGVKE